MTFTLYKLSPRVVLRTGLYSLLQKAIIVIHPKSQCSRSVSRKIASSRLACTTKCVQGQSGQFNKTLPEKADEKNEITEEEKAVLKGEVPRSSLCIQIFLIGVRSGSWLSLSSPTTVQLLFYNIRIVREQSGARGQAGSCKGLPTSLTLSQLITSFFQSTLMQRPMLLKTAGPHTAARACRPAQSELTVQKFCLEVA